jgi:hypothetical protein
MRVVETPSGWSVAKLDPLVEAALALDTVRKASTGVIGGAVLGGRFGSR